MIRESRPEPPLIDLEFRNVSKRYRVRQEFAYSTSQNKFVQQLKSLRRRAKDFWALRDVSFEVKRGEALGIIGHNGAGKSTILKLLASITSPTSGQITINGRLAALIEVGSGFHPELSGRENIYLSGSILGMRRREITGKLDRIIDFAGVREFIDTPVKRYSSGMYVRLGFAIAAHLEPDILLLDEVLAVGDAAFQAKCMNRIKEMESAGTTIVFISHDLRAVERICDRAILMEKGRITASGSPSDVIKAYGSNVTSEPDSAQTLCFRNSLSDPTSPFEVESIEVLDEEGQLRREIRTGDYVRFKIVWRSAEFIEKGGVELGIYTLDGVPLIRYSNQPISGTDIDFHPGINSAEVEFTQFPLAAGEYRLGVGLTIPTIEWLYRNDHFGVLSVGEGNIFQGAYLLTSSYSILTVPHRWITTEHKMS